MTRSIHAAAIIAVVTLFFCLSMLAQAAVPSSLNYQGYLTDTDGSSIDGDIVVTFSIYTTDLGGTFVWTDTELITVDQGLFSVELGADNPFPPDLFVTPLWLGVAVDGDDEMLPRRPLTTVGFAFQADDALSLQGQTPAAFDQAAHVADMSNPHGVDAAQTGAATSTDIVSLQAQLDAALASISALQTDVSTIQTDVSNNNSIIATVQTNLTNETTARVTADSAQDSVITGIQANSVLALDGVLTRPDSETALFTAVNVQVVSGSGTTNGSINGLGNLLVGYNSARASVSDKSGSHNLVVGDNHNYASYGGFVSGYENTVSGVSASVSGGKYNTASGLQSSISGGAGNTASGTSSSVSGGADNTASGDSSSVSGGENNFAGMVVTSVSGGNNNWADEYASSISGGFGNVATGEYASISGGFNNSASGFIASVSGGSHNTASGSYSSLVGGGGPAVEDGGEAAADYSTTLGNHYAIGDTGPAGGIVFHVTADGLHGLEAAPVDQATSVEWGCDGTAISGADWVVVGSGARNTEDIIAGCSTPGIAADIANYYSLNGFDDWFLPSKDELDLMYFNLRRVGLGGFANDNYWSSSEFNTTSASIQNFTFGNQIDVSKDNDLRVRAARAF